jgi:hypothetical protein
MFAIGNYGQIFSTIRKYMAVRKLMRHIDAKILKFVHEVQ